MSLRLHAYVPVALVLLACGTRSGPPRPNGGELPRPDASISADMSPDAAAAGPCQADAQHCCQPDGTVVVPGGCQPSYPDNVAPATRRGPDGRCVRIECHLKCLPADARIRTPDGARAIRDLRAGDIVWTADCAGRPRAAALLAVSVTPADQAAQIIGVTLADGRIVRGSPGHPTLDGTRLDVLTIGAALDGSVIAALAPVPLHSGATYDILPAGATGAYWADDVLLGSTLAASSCPRR